MADEYIRKQDALKEKKTGTFANGTCLVAEPCVTVEYIESLEPADVVPYSIAPDGTLTIIVPKGTKRIGRILIEEDVTKYGGMFYPDTGGCFLSSMERSEQDGNERCNS